MKKKLQKLTSLTLASAITLASCSPNGTDLINELFLDVNCEKN